MKKNQQLNKLINNLVTLSFEESGKINQVNVSKYIKILSTLNKTQAILTLSLYLKQLKNEIRKYTLIIESTVSLGDEQINKIKNNLKSEYKISEVETLINPSLIGGLRIKIGDVVFDDSLNNKINQLGESII